MTTTSTQRQEAEQIRDLAANIQRQEAEHIRDLAANTQRQEAEQIRDLAANIQDDYSFDKGAVATALRAYANTLHPATTLADIQVDDLMGQLWKAVDVAIPTGFGEWKRTPAYIVNVETGTGHVSATDGTGGYWRLPRSAHGRITLHTDRNDNVIQEGK